MKNIMVFGASGTIGRAVVQALSQRGYNAIVIMRPARSGSAHDRDMSPEAENCEVVHLDIFDEQQRNDCMKAYQPVAIISCLASRTGTPADAQKIDLEAQTLILDSAKAVGIAQFILLSAICVQRPQLAFQKAKLLFESRLADSGLAYSIVRPTAFFKSLSGQVARVKAGKPFLVFGDGKMTSCKPISDRDLAHFLVDCLDDEQKHNQILPIGGPGPPITPLDQAEALFTLTGNDPKIRHIPLWFLNGLIALLRLAGLILPAAAEKAELAKIGRYYATQSMLLWDDKAQCYDAKATPSYGSDHLFEHYQHVISGTKQVDLRDHAVF